MKEAIALTEETFKRFDDAARAYESADVREQSRAVLQSPIVQYLKITSGASNSQGYPAYIQATADGGGTWANQSSVVVRVKTPGGATLLENQYVHARFAGLVSGVGCYIAIGAIESQCGGSISGISGYNGSVIQLLGHDASGCLKWYNVDECP